ncbi:GntR family transcriptional regulator/MocR family aminotransferase [Streptacidiphilus sp. MAP12-20]|uniref:MocR-like pyridoxine biosynthesis transcription factor PdxR n=1 Tax=Streptacidiphilus sp. MAP12-20 TaxID=3156299 RepID=UPI0035158F02
MDNDWSTFGVDLHLDLAAGRDPGEGVRTALERSLREAVRAGRLAAGTRLPATRALAAELGIARGTVSAAYDQLAAEGYLIARHGSGTRVADVARAERPATRGTPAPPRHDLRPGRPDMGSFPVAEWLRASRRALGEAPPAAFGYGDPRGRPELRAALADYLGRARGVDAAPGRIVITSGYVQALGLLARVLPPGAFAMEDPGLPFHREVARFAGREVVPLPVDRLGADPSSLAGSDVAAAVVTPAHQYPTGVTLPPERRRALIAWARDASGVVVEDDYDGEFRYDRQPVGAVQGTAPDSVVYVGTAAKTLAPGVRLAWLVLPARLVEPVMRAKRLTDYQTESLGQLTLAEFLTSHAYDRHVRASRGRYRRRRDLLLAAGAELPGCSLEGVAAGQHVLLGLPAGAPPEQLLLRRASAHGLSFDTLADHWHAPSAAHRQGLILGYGTPREAAFPLAVTALTRLLQVELGP